MNKHKIAVFTELFWPEDSEGKLATHVIVRDIPSNHFHVIIISGIRRPFLINMAKSARKNSRIRARLYAKIIVYIMKNLRREPKIRNTYYPKLSKPMKALIVDLPNPLIREEYAISQMLLKLCNYVLYERSQGWT